MNDVTDSLCMVKSLMFVWSKACLWHEMLCRDPDDMGLKPAQVEHGCVVFLTGKS